MDNPVGFWNNSPFRQFEQGYIPYFRYMVAKNDIRAGQIIIRENPLVVGPCVGGKIQCIGCYKNLEEADKMFKWVQPNL